MQAIHIEPTDPAGAEARELIAQLDAFHIALYPAESNHLLSVDALRQPHVTFLMATVDGQAAAIGAFVNHGEYAEIKRMYVLPTFRGRQLGRRMLEEIETRIRAAGLTVARLETGIHQTEALRLYETAGYRRREPFGEYVPDSLSVFMEKKLT
jgi:putative acetyltransferase